MFVPAWCKKIWEINKFLPLLSLVLAVLTLGLFALGELWLGPQGKKLQSELARRQQVLNRVTGDDGRQLPAREVITRGRADLKKFWEKIPQRSEFPQLVEDISSLARMAGLYVNRVQYTPKEISGEELLRYGLNFSVTGEYAKIKKFIFLIEKSDRILTIDEVSFQGKNEAQAAAVQMSVRLSTLFKT